MSEPSYPDYSADRKEETGSDPAHGGGHGSGDTGGGGGDLGGQGQGEEDNNGGDTKPDHDTGTE